RWRPRDAEPYRSAAFTIPRGATLEIRPPFPIPPAPSQGRLALPGPRTVPVRSAHDTPRGAIGNPATRFNPTRCEPGTARAPPDRGPCRSAALTTRRGARLGIWPTRLNPTRCEPGTARPP